MSRKFKNQPAGLTNKCQIFMFRLKLRLISLGMSEVDTVWAWGGHTSTPLISKYFWEIFSASHIKLTYNNPNKDFESVKRP